LPNMLASRRKLRSACENSDLDATLFYHMKRLPSTIFPLYQPELEDQGPDGLHSFDCASRAQVQCGNFSIGSDMWRTAAKLASFQSAFSAGQRLRWSKAEVGKGEVVKGEVGKGEVVKGEAVKGEVGKGEVGKGEVV
jgi:hypothetical protein